MDHNSKEILLKTKRLLEKEHMKFVGDTIGDLNAILDSIWRTEIECKRPSIHCDISRYGYLTQQLEDRGFKVITGARFGEPTLCISWKEE